MTDLHIWHADSSRSRAQYGSGTVMRPDSFIDSDAIWIVYLRPYLFTSLRTDPFHFQAWGRKKRPNLILVFCVYLVLKYILLRMHV